MSESDNPYVIVCSFCGRPAQDDQQCECMTRTPSGDAQTIADLRAQIEQQEETISAFQRVVEMRDQRIAELIVELEGRAKGSEA